MHNVRVLQKIYTYSYEAPEIEKERKKEMQKKEKRSEIGFIGCNSQTSSSSLIQLLLLYITWSRA